MALNVAAACIFAVGAIFHVDQMFLMALALVLLPLASWIIGRILSGGVVCTRYLSGLCAAGDVVPVKMTITSTVRLPRPALRISDMLPRRLRPVGESALLLLDLHPGETREATYWVQPERRGRYTLGPTRVETWDLLGFASFVQITGDTAELVVYPTPLPLRRLFWENAAPGGAYSRTAATRRGSGMDFHGVREYQPGDELRHVHWRTTARTGQLAVAEYEQGTHRDAVVVLDLSLQAYANAGRVGEELLEMAVTLAASVCAFLARRGEPVRLLTPRDISDPTPPSVGAAVLPRILEVLVDAEADSSLSLAETLMEAQRLTMGQATLVCITPMPQDYALTTTLSNLAAHGVPITGLALGEHDGLFRFWRTVRRGDDLIQILEG